MPAAALKPTHPAIHTYYVDLQDYARQGATHEGALETAFQHLLAEVARLHHWDLIPKLKLQIAGKTIIPDGTLRDRNWMPRGYWEAKDTADNLDTEIKKKIARGYPLTNTIFEDTRQGFLYQNGEMAMRADLTQPQHLVDLLNTFFSYTTPAYTDFRTATEEFQRRVPDLARGLVQKIQAAHDTNTRFQAAFEHFFALCRTSLNQSLRAAAVDEMLVQHLLTERILNTVFDNQDFTRRNAIAREVEKVIDALVSKAFNRHEFLQSLDRFYVAVESAAQTIPDFTEKQYFLNTVYEQFFQGYSVKVADTHSIVYTPRAIVDFMCTSVVEVLQTEFSKGLGDRSVNILDPCTGTGSFIVNLLRHIPKRDLPRMYREQIFANEVMLLPYYVAALNIEHAYYELTGTYEPFAGLCFVDTLDLAEGSQGQLAFMTAENTVRVERQRKAPITVIIGNPPYNVGQLNENDNNKNRKYPVIDKRVKDTYAKDSRATSVSKLNDPYVKFFRWAVDRLQGCDGIVCFITNNSFVDQIAFDGMRKHLMQDFTHIYHLHLEGNVRHNPKLTGTTYNVFGIQVGVGITVAVRSKKHDTRQLHFQRMDKNLRREEKLTWLSQKEKIGGVEWQALIPDFRYTWLAPVHADEFASFLPIGSKEGRAVDWSKAEVIFKEYSLGVATHRDSVMYDFSRDVLAGRVKEFIDAYNGEVDRYRRAGGKANPDEFVRYDKVIWDRDLKKDLQRGKYAEFDEKKIRTSLYHPFSKRFLFFDRMLNAEVYSIPSLFPTSSAKQEDRIICVPGGGNRQSFGCLITTFIPALDLAFEKAQCFPFYIYNDDGSGQRENVTDWALKQFRSHYGSNKISKWDIFYYVYGLLHHPGYREKFADNLKRELPRIPLAPDFQTFTKAGKRLADLHLKYEQLEPYPLKWIETEGIPLSYRVEDKMRLSKDKSSLQVNDSLTLAGIPPEVFRYRLGNRSALEWVIDQYRVEQDERSGIRSDPNRAEDEEYIVRLVGQVIRVSVETVKIIQELPAAWSGALPSRADSA
jgi:predicted helicase